MLTDRGLLVQCSERASPEPERVVVTRTRARLYARACRRSPFLDSRTAS